MTYTHVSLLKALLLSDRLRLIMHAHIILTAVAAIFSPLSSYFSLFFFFFPS